MAHFFGLVGSPPVPDNCSRYFQHKEPIRHIIYATNNVEEYHRQVRIATKAKGVFANDDALYKSCVSLIVTSRKVDGISTEQGVRCSTDDYSLRS